MKEYFPMIKKAQIGFSFIKHAMEYDAINFVSLISEHPIFELILLKFADAEAPKARNLAFALKSPDQSENE